MTIRAQLYGVLLTTAEALVEIEGYLIEHPHLDPDDELFNEAQRGIDAVVPILQRLCAEPELPAWVQVFLQDVTR